MLLNNVRKSMLLALIVLPALLQGCATKSTVSIAESCPVTPSPPDTLMKPEKQESYLDRVQRNTEAWEKRLTASETK